MVSHWVWSSSGGRINCIEHHAWWSKASLKRRLWTQSLDLWFVDLRRHWSTGNNWGLWWLLQISVVNWNLPQRLTIRFHWDDILLHVFDENVVIEIDDIFLLIWWVIDLHINIENWPVIALEKLSVFCDNHVKCNLHSWLYLANTVYGTHYHLINHSVDKKMSFSRELHFDDGPDFFSNIIL